MVKDKNVTIQTPTQSFFIWKGFLSPASHSWLRWGHGVISSFKNQIYLSEKKSKKGNLKSVEFYRGLEKILFILNLILATCFKKSWDRGMFTTVLHHLFFKRHSKLLQTMETNCCKNSERKTFSIFCFRQYFSCSTDWSPLLCIFFILSGMLMLIY